MNRQQHGYEESDGVSTHKLIRSNKTLLQQLRTVYTDQTYTSLLLLIMIAACFVYTAYYQIITAIYCFILMLHLIANRQSHLPMEMPSTHPGKDYHLRSPGGKQFDKSQGRYYYGNTQQTNQQLWSAFKRVINHVLAFGATGSGKTEFLISIATNALATASGYIYIDPKASQTLYPRLYTISRRFAREDDVRVVSFHINKQKDRKGKTTNTLNILKNGNAYELANIFITLMPPSDPKNMVFHSKAQNLIRSFFLCWIELRDQKRIPSTVSSIRDSLTIDGCIRCIQDQELSEQARQTMRAFMASVGYRESLSAEKQSQSLTEQFGFALSYFSNTLTLIIDNYGHIFENTYGEINIQDSIQRKRIIIPAIPSLGLSSAEVKNLGSINLSVIRMALGAMMEPIQEGIHQENQTDNQKTPYPLIVDEYAAIGIPDYIITVTQARFLNIASVIGAQDYAGIKGIDPQGAQQLVENTRFKAIFRLETGEDTFKLVQAIAGQITVLETTGFETSKQGLSLQYYDKQSTAKQTRNKMNLQDLIAQTEGEFHGLYGGEIFRAHAFYVDQQPTGQTIRINHLIQPMIQDQPIETTIQTQHEPLDQAFIDTLEKDLIVAWEIGADDQQSATEEIRGLLNAL